MNTDGLLTKLLGIFFDHLLAALLRYFSECPGLFVLLLHAKEAHLSFIETLFRILEHSNVRLK